MFTPDECDALALSRIQFTTGMSKEDILMVVARYPEIGQLPIDEILTMSCNNQEEAVSTEYAALCYAIQYDTPAIAEFDKYRRYHSRPTRYMNFLRNRMIHLLGVDDTELDRLYTHPDFAIWDYSEEKSTTEARAGRLYTSMVVAWQAGIHLGTAADIGIRYGYRKHSIRTIRELAFCTGLDFYETALALEHPNYQEYYSNRESLSYSLDFLSLTRPTSEDKARAVAYATTLALGNESQDDVNRILNTKLAHDIVCLANRCTEKRGQEIVESPEFVAATPDLSEGRVCLQYCTTQDASPTIQTLKNAWYYVRTGEYINAAA